MIDTKHGILRRYLCSIERNRGKRNMGTKATKLNDIDGPINMDALRCPYCWNVLEKTKTDDGNGLYCPNDMCLNEFEYDLEGNEKCEED